MNSITPRPDFHGPDEFVANMLYWKSLGYDPVQPTTISELKAALEADYEFACRWLPSAEECARLGIDPHIGQPVEPLSDYEQDRILVTLRDNADFRVAIRSLILERGAA